MIIIILIMASAILCVLEFKRNRKGNSISRETGNAALILGIAMVVLLIAFIGGTSHIASRETAAIIGIISVVIMLPGISVAVLVSRIASSRAA
jgi:peptidoglycan/LPS O-acetylase OafA/YrhL